MRLFSCGSSLALALAALCGDVATAIDNGLGAAPPRGWRSWNQFGTGINQSLIEAQYAAMVSRSRTVGGVPTSLLDLGFSSAGIDDGWQKCDSGPGGVGFHDAKGYPIVDTDKFPDMKAMTTKARSLGLAAGWYGNNCACKETRPECAWGLTAPESDMCFAGDVNATLDFGFSSIKIDSCGIQRNMTHYAQLFNRSGKAVMLEDCHNGNPYHPTRVAGDRVDCPMNFFRTSADIRPQWGSILSNLMTTSEFNAGLAGPGCYGYPDMLEVGVSQMPARGGLETLTPAEARTHFAAWCIVSSPLTLSHDLTNDTTMDAVWPIISNREALAVNEAWVGDAGVLVKKSDEMLPFSNCHWGFNQYCTHAASMVWKKELPGGKVAVLLMNNRNTTADVTVSWVDLPPDMQFRCSAGGCPVRDIYAQKDLGVYDGGFTAKGVAPHDSAFVVVQQCVKEATYPFHCVAEQSELPFGTGINQSLISRAAGCGWSALQVYYNAELQSNIVALAGGASAAEAKAAGYQLYSDDNGVAANATCGGFFPGMHALSTFVHIASTKTPTSNFTDTLLVGSDAGKAWAALNHYVFVRDEGFCFATEASCVAGVNKQQRQDPPPCAAATQWHSSARQDSFLALNGTVNAQGCANAGYVPLRVECWLAVQNPVRAWTAWPASGPANSSTPASCPFAPSAELVGFEFLRNGIANYGGADTWYPTWAADGTMYTPWTDGSVGAVHSGSGGHGPGEVGNSTTGQATVTGDDPYNLTLTGVTTFTSNTAPYQGRYPCGSLFYEGVWYYGTYSLENPSFPPNPLPNCGNWCVQGPFCGFRQSADKGATWAEPRLEMASATDNLFGESAMNNSKVKYGAPHVVDFGRELEHSPDGRVYLVGHGASLPTAHQSWMQGDEVYMARCCGDGATGKPTPAGMNDLAQWQFWDGEGGAWNSGAAGVAAARPLLTWNNHTGVVTMTYVAALKKYVTCISTPTFSPYTVKQFDTYFLESDSLTGPFRLIEYLSEFGPEAYFVNIPSKFVDGGQGGSGAGGKAGTMGMFLSYSANFAFKHGANPPGSGYHWSLQQMRFKLGGRLGSGAAGGGV